MNDNVLYFTKRLIDTCLREDLFGLVSKSNFINALPEQLNIDTDEKDQTWLAFFIARFKPLFASYTFLLHAELGVRCG